MRWIFVVILLSAGLIYAQNATPRYEYTVNDFSGGINLSTDSMNMAPNEAVDLLNMRLDRFGHLHKRYGFQNFTDSIFGGGERIRDILYLTTKDSGDFKIYAGDNYVYAVEGWGPDTIVDWVDQRIGYNEGKIVEVNSYYPQNYVYVKAESTEWIGSVSIGDSLVIDDTIFNALYIRNILADTAVLCDTNGAIPDTIADFEYHIYKVSHGDMHLSSFNGRAYVADAAAPSWTWDGARVWNLAVVDTGTVDTVFTQSDTVQAFIFSPFTLANILDNKITGDTVAYFDTVFNNGAPLDTVTTYVLFEFDIVGDSNILNSDYPWTPWVHFTRHFAFWSTIDSITNVSQVIWLNKEFTNANCHPAVSDAIFLINRTVRLDGTVTSIPTQGSLFRNCFLIPRAVRFHNPGENTVSLRSTSIYDSRKNILDGDFLGMFIVNTNNAREGARILACHDEYIVADSMASFTVGDRYYVLSWMPVSAKFYDPDYEYWDSLRTDQVYFSQIMFFNKRLYAIGKEYTQNFRAYGYAYFGGDIDTINQNRIWYSDIGRPSFINDAMNVDLDGANSDQNQSLIADNASQAIFGLNSALYTITKEAIYRLTTSGQDFPISSIERIAKNFGVEGPHAVCVYPDNNAYLMNNDGVWRFDGSQINPIEYFRGSPAQSVSYKVKDFTEKYRQSNKVVGYFKDEIYFSYPDSDFTLCYFAPTGGFTNWDVGMDAINTQSVAIDSNYFLFSSNRDSSLIFRYSAIDTNDAYIYYDQYPWATVGFEAKYGSGWITFPQDYYKKILERMYLDLGKGDGSVIFNVYADFGDTAIFTDTLTASVVKQKFRLSASNSDNNETFDYFRITLDAVTNSDLHLFGYKVRVYDGNTTGD